MITQSAHFTGWNKILTNKLEVLEYENEKHVSMLETLSQELFLEQKKKKKK